MRKHAQYRPTFQGGFEVLRFWGGKKAQGWLDFPENQKMLQRQLLPRSTKPASCALSRIIRPGCSSFKAAGNHHWPNHFDGGNARTSIAWKRPSLRFPYQLRSSWPRFSAFCAQFPVPRLQISAIQERSSSSFVRQMGFFEVWDSVADILVAPQQRNRSRRRASVTYTLAHPQSPPNTHTHTHTHTSHKVHEKAYRELNFMYTFMAMCTRLLWGPCYAYRNDEFLAEQNASWSPMGHSPILIRWH